MKAWNNWTNGMIHDDGVFDTNKNCGTFCANLPYRVHYAESGPSHKPRPMQVTANTWLLTLTLRQITMPTIAVLLPSNVKQINYKAQSQIKITSLENIDKTTDEQSTDWQCW